MATIRNIVTVYYYKHLIQKTTRGQFADRAVLNCIMHLQKNDYAATIAEIRDDVSGKLIAIITRNVLGKITIRYQNTPVFVFDPKQNDDDLEELLLKSWLERRKQNTPSTHIH